MSDKPIISSESGLDAQAQSHDIVFSYVNEYCTALHSAVPEGHEEPPFILPNGDTFYADFLDGIDTRTIDVNCKKVIPSCAETQVYIERMLKTGEGFTMATRSKSGMSKIVKFRIEKAHSTEEHLCQKVRRWVSTFIYFSVK